MEVLDSYFDDLENTNPRDQRTTNWISEVSVITTIHIKLLLPYSMELLN